MDKSKIGLLVALLGTTACAPSSTKRTTAPLDDVLRAAVEQRRVPAVVAMVATADGVAYQGAFGVGKDGIFSIAIHPVFLRIDPAAVAGSRARALGLDVDMKVGAMHLHLG